MKSKLSPLFYVSNSLCACLILLTSLSLPLTAQESTGVDSKVAATVQGTSITWDDLNKSAADEFEKLEVQKMQFEAQYEQARHQVLETTLRHLIEDKLLRAEAAKRGISKEELISLEITSKVKEPTQAEIDFYYETNKARIGAGKEWVNDQIKKYLDQQNKARAMETFLESLKKSYPVVSNLSPIRYRIETKGHPSKGPDNAPVTIVEFADFQCNYCQTMVSTLNRIVTDFSGSVRIVYRQFPNPKVHPFSQKAAEASLCANEQGKFWEMHDLMFQEPNQLSIEDLNSKAVKLGLTKDAFQSCLDSGRYQAKTKKDFLDANRAGVSGTPAIFINGRLFPGMRPYDELAAIIKEELKSIKTPSSGKP